ncbi:protein kinase domain-containing protein [Kribbella sp. CA-245084]|uniref:serine/threonine-protein kinase n=1 Tax=Kribbella sp. CA-245084 TaxID=3239940 RepID=UPI003D8AE6F5
MSGRLIGGRYLLGEPLGSGGMGSVWRAHDQQLDRMVALKRAHPGVDDPDGRRLRREARTGARLHDPHVVTIFDVVADGDEHWLVLEYLPSRSLDELGTLPSAQVARIGVQIASALQAVHAAGIIHRDLKPANVLVTSDGTAKLADFGISRRLWAEATLTDSSTVGTPAHLAPEVANGNEPTTAADVFSLGAVLYTALEGHSPFGSDPNPLAVLRRAARGELEPLRKGGELTPLITRMLAVDPQDRPSVAEVVQELGGTAIAPVKSRKRWTIPVTVAGVAVVVVLSVLIGRAVSGPSEPSGSPAPSAASTTPTRSTPTGGSSASTAPAAGPVGDPLTVDPCALIDEKSLSRFGQTTLEPAYGNFDRCDVVVTGKGDQEVDVRAELNLPYTDSPRGAVQKFTGNLRTVTRVKSGGDDCERVLVLSDRTQIQVEAKHTDGSGMDVCAMAEAVTQKAIGVVQAGPIPRRAEPLPATSLAHVNACTLLDNKALQLVPGVDATHPDTSFGNWSCGWDSTTSDLSVDLYFDRNQPLDASDGQPITVGGRSAFLSNENDGPKTCAVVIVYRTYVDSNGQDAVELVTMSVGGSAKPASLCGLATKLAQAAVVKLPKA